MKFFTRRGFQYTVNSPDAQVDDIYSLSSAVYGPYADDKAVQEAIGRLKITGVVIVFDGEELTSEVGIKSIATSSIRLGNTSRTISNEQWPMSPDDDAS